MSKVENIVKKYTNILSMSKLNSAKLILGFALIFISTLALFVDKMDGQTFAWLASGIYGIFCGSRAATDIMTSKAPNPLTVGNDT